MFATTLFSNRAIALSAITLLHATSEVQAAITLSMSETRVSRDQSVVQGQTEGIVAMAGAPVDTKGADAFFALDNDGTVLTVDVGIGLGTGGSTYKMMIDSGVGGRIEVLFVIIAFRMGFNLVSTSRARTSGLPALVVKVARLTLRFHATRLILPPLTERPLTTEPTSSMVSKPVHPN
jgi:hypothetical protein